MLLKKMFAISRFFPSNSNGSAAPRGAPRGSQSESANGALEQAQRAAQLFAGFASFEAMDPFGGGGAMMLPFLMTKNNGTRKL